MMYERVRVQETFVYTKKEIHELTNITRNTDYSYGYRRIALLGYA